MGHIPQRGQTERHKIHLCKVSKPVSQVCEVLQPVNLCSSLAVGLLGTLSTEAKPLTFFTLQLIAAGLQYQSGPSRSSQTKAPRSTTDSGSTNEPGTQILLGPSGQQGRETQNPTAMRLGQGHKESTSLKRYCMS